MIKVIEEGFPHSDEILVDEVTVKYIQESDHTGIDKEDIQELIISTRDEGGEKFFNIKTESWSLNEDNSEIIELLKDFKNRVYTISNNS